MAAQASKSPLRLATLALLAHPLLLGPVLAQEPAVGAGSEAFHRAYYLEHEGDPVEAQRLYQALADDPGAPAELRQEARRRAEGLREDVLASDLARLMPADAILYAELEAPGAKLSLLLDQLGLLGAAGEGGRAFGISPLLVDGLLGLRGAAVAVTGFDPRSQQPTGVLVLHPGDLDVVRGLIETAVPAGGQAAEPLEGRATWMLEDGLFVTLTSRLVVASQSREAIRGVLARLSGARQDSLAASALLEQGLERGDGLLSFHLNPAPLLPLAHAALAQAAAQDPQAALLADLLDVDSLRSLAGVLSVDEQGLALEVELRLAEGHRNLVFNLLRTPQVDVGTLALVPQGAAFVLAFGLNPSGAVPPILDDSQGQPVVMLGDFGRELFGNVVGLSVFGLPQEGARGGIPDVAAVVRVNDAARAQAVWGFALDLASRASEGEGAEAVRIAGADAQEFLVNGVPLYLASAGDRLVLTPSQVALARALAAPAEGGSVLEDPAFAAGLGAVGAEGQRLVLLHAGRLLDFALPWMPPHDAAGVAQVAPLLAGTVVALGLEHSETRLAVRARLLGIPDVSGLVEQQLGRRAAQPQVGRADAVRDASHDAAHHAPAEVSAAAPPPAPVPVAVSEVPPSLEERFARVEALAADASRTAEAAQLGGRLAQECDDPRLLNNLAWSLLTEEVYGGRLDPLALDLALRANELSGHDNWYYVDTLARAVYENGDLGRAIELQRLAVELSAGDPRGASAAAELQRYLSLRDESALADS